MREFIVVVQYRSSEYEHMFILWEIDDDNVICFVLVSYFGNEKKPHALSMDY